MLGTSMRIVQVAALSALMVTRAAGQQIVGKFRCESHTVGIDRLPGAKFTPIQEPTKIEVRKVLEADFSGFGPENSVKAIHFLVQYVPGSLHEGAHQGRLRILAQIESNAGRRWWELADDLTPISQPGTWYDNGQSSDLLRVDFQSPQPGEVPDPTDDPAVYQSGRPQLRIHQAEKGKPVFLLKYIGWYQAGGHGDVDTEEAMVLDFRGNTPAAPAAVGCIKNDFASEQHRDEWIDCRWQPRREDYVCRNNSFYDHAWSFFLIGGKKLPAKSKPRSR